MLKLGKAGCFSTQDLIAAAAVGAALLPLVLHKIELAVAPTFVSSPP